MPGNEVEDRVHNFFAQEDLSSNHHQSQAADGNWQGQGSNLWPGSHMQIGLPNSNSKSYNLQQSDIERGQNSHSFQVAQGLNYAQPHSENQLRNSNGYMHGRQISQTRQNEANFLGINAESDRHTMTSRGLPIYESQGRNGLENNVASVRSESSESRIGFDFLGGQQQQMGIPQNLLPQQISGYNDIQLMQQQAMMRKMQELQRHQLEAMHNNSLNQNNPSIINGTPISANNSWLNRATQGPSNELRFPTEPGQTLSLMGLTPQRSDQSLYGVPVSNTRGTSSHYSHVSADNKMAMFSNSSPGDQCRGPIDHVNVQGGFQEENLFGQPSGQSLVRGVYSENPQLVHQLQRDPRVQEFAGLSEKMEQKTVVQVSSSQNSVALDPTEEKILFGNGNIWDSFGDSDDIGTGGGSWSALMQSAVGETEEWSGPNIQNTEVSLSPLSDNNTNINKNFHGVPGFQQDIQKYSSEGTQTYQNSSDGIKSKSMLGSWSPQQNVTSPISGQIYGKPNGRDDVETPSSGNENRMLHMSQGVHMWKPIPGPQVTAGMDSPQGNREGEILNNNLGRPNSSTNNPNLHKRVEPSKMRKRNEHHLNQGSLVLESSMNSLGNNVVNMHERENSSESHHSNISQHTTSAGGSVDKVWLDGSDTRNLLGGKQKEQGGQKLPGPRKFQYHPMGNSDGDVKASFGCKPISNNQSQGYLGKSNSFGQFPKTSNEMEKGNIFGVQQNKKEENILPARRTLAGLAANIKQPSQNVLEFPHNTDQSKENSNSDKSFGPIKQSQSPSPHGFGLQLGFSSQLLPPQNQALSGPPSSAHTAPEIREKIDNTSQAVSYPSFRETSEGEYKKNGTSGTGSSNNNFPQNSMLGNIDSASKSRFPISRTQLQGQPHNKFPPSIFRPGQLNKNAALVHSSQQTRGENQQANVPFADVAPKPSVSQGKESGIKNQSENSPSNSASTESDFEAFGRSLKPSNLPPQSYSLLNQMRVMKSTEIDPNIRDLKRFKGAESSVGPQDTIVENQSKLSFPGSAGSSDNRHPSSDNRHPSSVLVHRRVDSGNYNCSTSTPSVKVENSNISPQMAPSWFEQYGTFKNGQMLSMYNTQKQTNLKTLEQQRFPLGTSSDSLRANIIKAQATVASDSVPAGNIWQRTILPPETVENLPSPQVEAYNVTDKALVVPKVKKRKSVAPFLSWHKEVTQGSQSLLTLRMAEGEWAKASNRIADKVEDETGTSEDGPPSRRYKRRLIATTQLMQQLFRPPMAKILSDDVYSTYEAVACMSARLALGDSCTLIPSSKADSCAPLDNINSSIDIHNTSDSERTSDQRFSEVAEQFIGRAKKLESDFMRLDKRVSVVDLRVETQELDKISVINRFARVHGRGQGDLAAPPGPQRYVNALPIPRVLPERVQCLSL